MADKFYKIGEVAKKLNLPTSTIRYWESNFKQLKPIKSTGGQRFYTEKHIEILVKLKDMLHNKKYTIEGAKRYFKELDSSCNTTFNNVEINNNSLISKEIIRNELYEILQLL